MTKFFRKFKESLILAHFWSIFPIWETGTIIIENLLLSQLTLYGKIQKKTVTQSGKKYSDRKKDRQGRQTVFYRPLRATSKLLPCVQENNFKYNQLNKSKPLSISFTTKTNKKGEHTSNNCSSALSSMEFWNLVHLLSVLGQSHKLCKC